ncbi:hypothetical protein MASR2M48_06660 [Spirochaetota bacterium]
MITKLMLGSVVVIGAVAAAIVASGGNVPAWAVAQSVLPVLGILAGVLFAGPGPGAIAEVFRARKGLSQRRVWAAQVTVNLAQRVLFLAGTAGFLIQFVYMMKSLEDRAALWPNLALALAPALAALVIHTMLILPLRHVLCDAGSQGDGAPSSAEALPDNSLETRPWSAWRFIPGTFLTIASLIAFGPAAVLSGLFVDIGSFIVAVFVPIGVLLAAVLPGSFRSGIKALRARDTSRNDLIAVQRSFSLLAKAVSHAAMIGAATGFVFLIKDWLNIMRYGPTLALALISVFWCVVILLLVVIPLEAEAERRYKQA